jgi:diketogulonate reductase-like aldo/keto reductase
MLIHAPKPWAEMGKPGNNYYAENLEVWKALEDAYAAGKFRAIGVSNFDVDDLKNIMDECTVMPAVNQVRVHIGHVPYEIIEFCEQNGILVEAYSPNAHGNLANIPVICQMAAKYDVSVPQLASRFILQLGLLPLPKSTHGERILQNADLDFEIMPADMAELLEIDGL